MYTQELKHICSGLMVFSVLLLFSAVQTIAAVESSETEETVPNVAIQADTEKAADQWEYKFEDRPDPFLPFIEEKVATKNIPQEEEIILTGMQVFEPGQLKLVAVMFSPKHKFAMVEDVTGKGYVLNEGMPIGRYGVVSRISMDQVNITETRTVAGKEIITPVVMRLNKEGDK